MDFLPQTGFLTMILNATLMVKVVMAILLFNVIDYLEHNNF